MYRKLIGILAAVLMGVVPAYSSIAAGKDTRSPRMENKIMVFELISRTPAQMAAFYEGRGFPPQALQQLMDSCFITAILRNKSKGVLWLELKNWRFLNEKGAPVRRLDRAYWRRQWQRLEVPLANQSTFGWTLLPEVRDLQPGEPVGGNVTLAPTAGPLTLEARFVTGEKKRGGEVVVRFEGFKCAVSGKGS